MEQRLGEWRSRGIPDRRYWRGLESEGKSQDVKLNGDEVVNGLGLRGLT